jgi:DNA-binding NarL/FixJ family response regulator
MRFNCSFGGGFAARRVDHFMGTKGPQAHTKGTPAPSNGGQPRPLFPDWAYDCRLKLIYPLGTDTQTRLLGQKPMSVEPRRIRVLMVDDHPLFREGVAAVLASQADMELIAEAVNGEEAISSFRQHRPDVTLMDLQMPGMGGLDAIRAILGECPLARIIVLTTYQGDVQATRALKAGAVGYLLKSTLRKELLFTIRQVHEGHRHVPGEIARAIAEHVTEDALSMRELQVLGHVAGGFSNKRIATHMGISVETVKTHMKNILSKVKARDRTEAVVIAMRRGIIDA